MNFTEMNLSINNEVNTINFNDNIIINVLSYLPIRDKNDLISIALQNSEENGVYNLIKLHMYFNMYLVILYTDIEFDNEMLENNMDGVYNTLKSNGIIDVVRNAIPESELAYLESTLDQTMWNRMNHKNTLASVINNFIENLPINAEAAKGIIENFDPAQFQQVLNFVQAANGNRPIN